MSTVSSVLSATTCSGFMAATASLADHQQAAALKLINGPLVNCAPATTVDAPADDLEHGSDGDHVDAPADDLEHGSDGDHRRRTS